MLHKESSAHKQRAPFAEAFAKHLDVQFLCKTQSMKSLARYPSPRRPAVSNAERSSKSPLSGSPSAFRAHFLAQHEGDR